MSFRDRLSGRTSRRTVLRKGAIGGSVGFLGLSSVARTGADDGPTVITEPTAIEEPGEYVLDSDLSVEGDRLGIFASDVTLDGNGHRLEGNGSRVGIILESGGHTIRNLTIEDFEIGLDLACSDSSFSSLTLQRNSDHGIRCFYARNILCEDLTIRGNGNRGVSVDDYTTDFTMRECEIAENGEGSIRAGSSATIAVKDCRLIDNGGAFVFTPIQGSKIDGTEISGNEGAGIRTNVGDFGPIDEGPTPITNCIVRDNDGAGIDQENGWLDVRECTLSENRIGYYSHTLDSRETILRHNNIEDNEEYGVLHTDRERNPTIDATCNWWGDESGPVHEDNPNDEPEGDRVSDGVEFVPWSVDRIEDGEGDCTGGLDEDVPDDETPPTGTGYIGEKSYKKIEGIGPYDSYGCWDGTFYVTDRSDIENLDYGSLGGMVLPPSADGDTEDKEDCQLFMGHVIRAEADAVPVRLPTWSGERGDCESLLFVEPTREFPPDVEYRIASTDGPIPQHEDVDTNGFAGTIDGLVAITFEPVETS